LEKLEAEEDGNSEVEEDESETETEMEVGQGVGYACFDGNKDEEQHSCFACFEDKGSEPQEDGADAE
jgi:hypothetical protein